MKRMILIAGIFLVFIHCNQKDSQTMNNEPTPKLKSLVILWTSSDPEVFNKVVFPYGLNSKKQEWWQEVELLIWGPSTKLLAESAELQEKVSQYRPGDDVKIVVKRNGDRKQFNVTLRNRHGDTQIVRDNVTVLGAMFETVSLDEMRNLDIENGIKITKLNSGKLKDAGLEEGFIITHVNKKPIFEVNDFKREIGNARGGILVEGIYPNGELAYFVFGVD